ncbi:TonB-dependent receptor [Polymorphobacter glacialis]|uniref:TonB-dependent receptor n=1 Tax=Sandarakinorhabdus glacialis TaxID=1614636 RepID=A0A917E7L8_9SPHN|nr:TonB-dependent receptor [Polymorphobacter glacialis]GGE08484.1 TonB-dependent receptor [Polymorphobacter glacialis]
MKSFWLASVAAFVVPAVLAPAAMAQTAAPGSTAVQAAPGGAVAQAAPDIDQNVIIVTATRRAQVLSDVPIAVSVVSAEQLQNSGGTDIRQLNQLAPSLLVSSATNESNGAARIRGIGTVGENPGLESSVAVFIDGVYRSRTGVGLTDLGPIERIEVLRGPQGTLFGRNASAGLINITTALPKFEFGGQGEATYGNFNNIRLMGSLTGPIFGDKAAFRVDGVFNKRDGFLRDVVSGRDLNNRDRFLVRGQLLLKPSDDLTVRLIGDYNQKNEECCGAAILSPVVGLSRDAQGNVVSGPNGIANLVKSLGGIYRTATDGKPYIYETALTPGVGYGQRTRDWGASGEVNWDLGGATLTSITGYREFKNKSAQDADFNRIDLLQTEGANRKFQTFSQEIRLQGNAFNDRLDYLVGGYFAKEKLHTDTNIRYGADFEAYYNAQLRPATGLPNTLQTFANAIGYVTPPGQSLLNNTGIAPGTYFKQQSTNYALFTHNVVSIVPDKVLLTLGLRYTNEKKELETVFGSTNNFCGALRRFAGPLGGLAPLQRTVTSIACVINNTAGPGFAAGSPGTERKEDEFTGTAVLSVKPIDEVLVYGSYSRGYKAGGFNLDTSALNGLNPQATDLQFAPEIVTAFEFGAKLDLREFKFNAALFYQRFNDFQLNTFNGVNFEVSNIQSCDADLGGRDRDLIAGNSACPGKSKAGVIAKGLELEAFLFPTDDLTVTTGFTYADTGYANNLTGLNGVSLAPTLFQLPGQQLSNSSQYVVTGSAAWTPKINETLSALMYLDFRYMSALNTGSDLDFEKIQDGFALVNGRIGLYGPAKRWGIELWGQNLFDVRYQQVAADAPLQGSGTFRAVQRGLSASASQIFVTFPAEPRTYGVTVRTKF